LFGSKVLLCERDLTDVRITHWRTEGRESIRDESRGNERKGDEVVEENGEGKVRR
jgi:hypothetical protein